MKKIIIALIMVLIFLSGCSKEASQLKPEEIEGLPLKEQVEKIVKNTELIKDYDFEVKVDDNSVAVQYAPIKVYDTTLAMSDKKDSFPNVAMTFVQHLKVLDLDEIVITSYEPKDSIKGLSRISALFTKETIKDIDFDKWNEEKKNSQTKFYRLSDAYLIRDNVWDKLDEDVQKSIGRPSKKHESQFWDYYGSIVD